MNHYETLSKWGTHEGKNCGFLYKSIFLGESGFTWDTLYINPKGIQMAFKEKHGKKRRTYRLIIFLSELKLKGSYDHLNFVLFKNLICALGSQFILCGFYSVFYLRHQEQTFTKYPRKWWQNCLFTFPLKWKNRGKIQITVGTFQFLIGYLEFISF